MGVLEDLTDFAKKYPRLREACRQEAERQLEESFEKLCGYIFTKEGKVPILNHEEIGLCRNNEKIKAVKSYKERTGKGLLFSKHFVEHFGFGNKYDWTNELGLS